MRLEPLCTFEWSYDTDGRVSGGYVVLRPFGSDDGVGCAAATAGCCPMLTV